MTEPLRSNNLRTEIRHLFQAMNNNSWEEATENKTSQLGGKQNNFNKKEKGPSL